MPQEQFRTPAKYWGVVEDAIRAALARIRSHQDAPEVAHHPPIMPQDWREGELLITMAFGPEAQAPEEMQRQLQAAVNLLALVVAEYHSGELKIPKAAFVRLESGLKITSAENKVEGFHVLRVTGGDNGARRLVTLT